MHVRWFFQLLHPPGRLCWRSHMNIRAHTHTPTLSLTHTYNHSLTHTRTRTHTHIHTHTMFYVFYVYMFYVSILDFMPNLIGLGSIYVSRLYLSALGTASISVCLLLKSPVFVLPAIQQEGAHWGRPHGAPMGRAGGALGAHWADVLKCSFLAFKEQPLIC